MQLLFSDITRWHQKVPEQTESDILGVLWKGDSKSQRLRTSRAVWARMNQAALSAAVTDSAWNKSPRGFDKQSLDIPELCVVYHMENNRCSGILNKLAQSRGSGGKIHGQTLLSNHFSFPLLKEGSSFLFILSEFSFREPFFPMYSLCWSLLSSYCTI